MDRTVFSNVSAMSLSILSPNKMPKGVIAGFETIQIQHKKAQVVVITFGTGHFILQPLIQVSAVQKTGQGIGYCQLLKLFRSMIEDIPLHDDGGMGRKRLDEF